MIETYYLDQMKAEARAALETFLDGLTVPDLSTGPIHPHELTLTASLRTSGPLPPQTLELVVTPLKVRTETTLITSGEKTGPRRLEDYFSPSDLRRVDDILES